MQALADAGAAVKTAEVEARRAREDLERCQAAATKRTELLDAATAHEQKADAHRLVSTALGADGVQSLLLEHAAPRIAEIATDLLEQSYGARWRVRIELQRTGGQGAKRKVIEDVRFIVRDSESSEIFGDDLDPGEQLLETLSQAARVGVDQGRAVRGDRRGATGADGRRVAHGAARRSGRGARRRGRGELLGAGGGGARDERSASHGGDHAQRRAARLSAAHRDGEAHRDRPQPAASAMSKGTARHNLGSGRRSP